MSKTQIFIFLLIPGLISCVKWEKEVSKKVFHMNINAGFTSMDPAYARNQANIWICNQLYNGLLQLDDGLNPVPCIAKSWEVDSTGKKYRFHLRNDVYFHKSPLFGKDSSRAVTASDFVYSFNRLLDPTVASPGQWIFNNKVKIDTVDGKRKGSFYALNDSTLEIRLTESFPPFPGLLTMQYCSVIPHEIAEKYGKDFRTHPIGTGPFKFALFTENERLILHRNSSYFEKDLPYLDAVDVRFMPNKQNEFLAFLQGEIDFLSGIDGSFKDNLLTRDGRLKKKFNGKFKMEKIPFLNTEYLGIQMNDSIRNLPGNFMRHKKIRQAINYGFDREKMLRYLRNNIGKPGKTGFIPHGLPAFDTSAVKGYYYSPKKARALLSEAGYPGGEGLKPVKLTTTAEYLDLCIFIENQLKDIGIPIEVEVVDPKLLGEMKQKAAAPFFRASWIADYPDGENYLALFYSKYFSPKGPNYTHFYNRTYDSLYERSVATTDPDQRRRIYHRMENIIIDQAPVVVLYYDEVVRLSKNEISGLGRNAINLLNLKKVKIAEE